LKPGFLCVLALKGKRVTPFFEKILASLSVSMLHKLRSASRLSPTDWLYFIQAWFWLLVFDLGLRTRSFSSLQTFAARLSPRPIPEKTEALIQALKTSVDHARHNHLYPMTCLRRALTLQKMLAQRGLAAELKIGVRKEAGQFLAHAWVEYQGQPLGEAEKITENFAELKKAAANDQ
jgi:hypothetical protein